MWLLCLWPRDLHLQVLGMTIFLLVLNYYNWAMLMCIYIPLHSHVWPIHLPNEAILLVCWYMSVTSNQIWHNVINWNFHRVGCSMYISWFKESKHVNTFAFLPTLAMLYLPLNFLNPLNSSLHYNSKELTCMYSWSIILVASSVNVYSRKKETHHENFSFFLRK